MNKNNEQSIWRKMVVLRTLCAKDEERHEIIRDINDNLRKKWDPGDATIFHVMEKNEQIIASSRQHIQNILSSRDPGTAGDATEEAWKKVLQGLFPTYRIITKGTITGLGSNISPQIDILIINPSCPKELIDTKLIPIDLTIAAFECKLNLRYPDVKKSIETSRILKEASRRRVDDPIACIPIFYGILGLGCGISNKNKHSHDSVLDIIRKSTSEQDSLNLPDVIVIPKEFCLAAELTICCENHEKDPLSMNLYCNYLIQSKDLCSYPVFNPMVFFAHKLFSHISKLNKEILTTSRTFELFVRYHPHTESIAVIPLDKIIPHDFIEKLSKHHYLLENVIFELDIN